MKDVVRSFQDEKTGVEVRIIEQEDRYDVIITIPPNLFEQSNELFVHNGKFDLEAKWHTSANKPNKPITISLNRGYWKTGFDLIKNKQAQIKFDIAECVGMIRLSPKFYISQSRRASQKKLKKAKKAERTSYSTRRGKRKSSSSKYTLYKMDNLTRPIEVEDVFQSD